MNTDTKEEVILRKCSNCGCKKLLKFYKVRASTGALYKTCIQCCEKGIKGHKKCPCGTNPLFGYPDDKIPTCCAKCKKDDMVDIKSKRCPCGTQPLFGYPDDKKPTCCSKCKKDDMVDIKNKRCPCGTRPSFGYPDDKKPTCCSKCKKDDMVDIKHKKCPCGTIPHFGYPDDKIPTCCSKCKKDDMVDIKNKRCKTTLCDIQANTKCYRGYCSRCFFFTFPDEKLSRNYKTKENLVTQYIKNEFPQYDWVADKRVKYGCSLKRPDMYCDFGSHIVVQETDESCHLGYPCDNKRMMEISKDFGHRPCIFVRFNPDGYTNSIGKKVSSCFVVKKDTGKLEVKNVKTWESRLKLLRETIEKYGDGFVTEKTIIVEQLFYN